MDAIDFILENWIPIVSCWVFLGGMAVFFNYCASVASNGWRR